MAFLQLNEQELSEEKKKPSFEVASKIYREIEIKDRENFGTSLEEIGPPKYLNQNLLSPNSKIKFHCEKLEDFLLPQTVKDQKKTTCITQNMGV